MNINIQKLIEARVETGLSLKEIAQKSGVSRITLYRIERGISKPTAKTLKKICDFYKKKPSHFLNIF